MTYEARKIHASRVSGELGWDEPDVAGPRRPAASDKLVVTERFRRPAFGRLGIDVTINDPTYYTQPWTATVQTRLVLGTELFEFICNENERSTRHMGPNKKK